MNAKLISALCLILAIVSLAAPAYAATESETAAARLAERGIFEGDANGSLNLGQSLTRAELAVILTRAELAVILTRLDFADAPGGLAGWKDRGLAHFSDPTNRYNTFTDLPDWALPYIEYCYEGRLMNGVGGDRFDPQGKVSPKMACTVMLRRLRMAETDWNYDTSVEKARGIGIAPVEGTDGNELLRGAMAVIISRGMDYAATAPQAQGGLPAPEANQAPPTAQPGDKSPATAIDEMKAEIVRLTNEERAKAGLPALEILPELMDSAQLKAQDMLDNHYYGHISPVYGSPSKQIRQYAPNAQSIAENLAPWTGTPGEAFGGWVESGEHYAHIISEKYTHIGVGIVEGANGGYWWVQHFAKL